MATTLSDQFSLLEKAISLVYDARVSSEVRIEAQQYCIRYQESEDSWQKSLENFLHSSHPQASVEIPIANQHLFKLEPRLWYLSVLEEKCENLTDAQRQSVQEQLLHYLMYTLAERASVSSDMKLIPEHPLILRKVGSILVRLTFIDFRHGTRDHLQKVYQLVHDQRAQCFHQSTDPQQSVPLPSFKAPVQTLKVYSAHVYTFLALCDTLDSILNSLSVETQNKFKDTMRENENLLRMAVTCKLILEDFFMCSSPFPMIYPEEKEVATAETTQFEPASVVAKCFHVVSLYVAWADIQLFCNEFFVNACYSALKSDSPKILEAATQFLMSIYRKKMDCVQRINLSIKIRLVDLILACSQKEAVEQALARSKQFVEDPSEFSCGENSCAYFELLNVAGLQLLDSLSMMNRGYEPTIQSLARNFDARVYGGVTAIGVNPYYVTEPSPEQFSYFFTKGWELVDFLAQQAVRVYGTSHPTVAGTVEPFLYKLVKQMGDLLASMASNASGGPQAMSHPHSVLDKKYTRLFEDILMKTIQHLICPHWYKPDQRDCDAFHDMYAELEQGAEKNLKQLASLNDSFCNDQISITLKNSVLVGGEGHVARAVSAQDLNEFEALMHAFMTCNEAKKDATLVSNSQIVQMIVLMLDCVLAISNNTTYSILPSKFLTRLCEFLIRISSAMSDIYGKSVDSRCTHLALLLLKHHLHQSSYPTLTLKTLQTLNLATTKIVAQINDSECIRVILAQLVSREFQFHQILNTTIPTVPDLQKEQQCLELHCYTIIGICLRKLFHPEMDPEFAKTLYQRTVDYVMSSFMTIDSSLQQIQPQEAFLQRKNIRSCAEAAERTFVVFQGLHEGLVFKNTAALSFPALLSAWQSVLDISLGTLRILGLHPKLRTALLNILQFVSKNFAPVQQRMPDGSDNIVCVKVLEDVVENFILLFDVAVSSVAFMKGLDQLPDSPTVHYFRDLRKKIEASLPPSYIQLHADASLDDIITVVSALAFLIKKLEPQMIASMWRKPAERFVVLNQPMQLDFFTHMLLSVIHCTHLFTSASHHMPDNLSDAYRVTIKILSHIADHQPALILEALEKVSYLSRTPGTPPHLSPYFDMGTVLGWFNPQFENPDIACSFAANCLHVWNALVPLMTAQGLRSDQFDSFLRELVSNTMKVSAGLKSRDSVTYKLTKEIASLSEHVGPGGLTTTL